VSQFGRGYKKDHPAKRTQKLSHELLGVTPTNPPSGSLEKYEILTLDQGQSGSCTFHGTPMAICISCSFAGIPLGLIPSPRVGYATVRTIERALPTDALTDSGAMPADVMTVLSSYGVTAMQGPTPDGRNSDIWTAQDTTVEPPNVNTDVVLDDLVASGQKILTGEYRVDETQPTFLEQVKAAITAGYAVGIGIFVDTAFENWDYKTAPQGLTTVNFNDSNGGGHWICLNAYQTNADGSVTFSGPNSWGSWGAPALVDQANCPNASGHWRATDAWMKLQAAQGMDIYVFRVAVGGIS
jgi:hypothetical protein